MSDERDSTIRLLALKCGASDSLKQIIATWDSEGWNLQRCDIRMSAEKLLRLLKLNPPNDVYAEDSEIVFEWQYPDNRIVRLWVNGLWCGESMTTYHDGRPTEWHDVYWGGPEMVLTKKEAS